MCPHGPRSRPSSSCSTLAQAAPPLLRPAASSWGVPHLHRHHRTSWSGQQQQTQLPTGVLLGSSWGHQGGAACCRMAAVPLEAMPHMLTLRRRTLSTAISPGKVCLIEEDLDVVDLLQTLRGFSPLEMCTPPIPEKSSFRDHHMKRICQRGRHGVKSEGSGIRRLQHYAKGT